MKRVLLALVSLFLMSGIAEAAKHTPKTFPPTARAIDHFAPLNFRDAAAREKANPPAQPSDIEEVDTPQPPPAGGRHGVEIAPSASGRLQSQEAPSFGTGISPPPAKTFRAEFLSGGVIPPDTMGAVGTTHIVTVTNDRMRILTRDGVEISRLTISSFWNGVTIKGAAVSAFDSKVFFDRFNNRFIMESSANSISVNSGVCFAVSATSDPTGTWYRWSMAADPTSTGAPGGSGNWIDYPSVGHNKNWIVVDENVFHYTCGATVCSNQSFWGTQVYILDKQAAYSNTLSSINLVSGNFNATCLTSATPESELACGFTMAPAITEDNVTDTEYLVEDWDSTAGQLRLSKIIGTPGAPQITVGTQFPQSPNSWRFDAARIGTANSCGGTCSGGYMPQRDRFTNGPFTQRIMANDSRVQNSVLRNGKLWCAQTVMLSASPQPAGTQIGGSGNPVDNHSGIQWWQIDPTNETAASTPPLQRGRIEDPTANNCHNGLGGTSAVAPCNGTTTAQFGEFFAFPNISVNQNEDVFIGFTRFSPLTFPNSGYVIRRSADPANTTRDAALYRPGQSAYNIGAGSGTARQNRWGDYSSAQTDPLNDNDFWTVQEYSGTYRNDFLGSYAAPWETWWTRVSPTAAAPSVGNLIISEFRLRGPQGARDEFVELYNPAPTPVIVQTTDNSDGWALAYSADGTTVTSVFAVVPNGTVIPAHGHFLVTDNPDNTAAGTSALTYSLNNAACTEVRGATSDTGWSIDLLDNGGIALFNTATTANFGAGTRLDSAGFSTITAGLFKEGNGIPAVTGVPTGQLTFYRDLSSGTPKDTGANENDFIFADPVVGETLGSTPRLGAAGPENLDSPISLPGSSTLPSALVDLGVGYGSPANQVRDNTVVTNGAFGTLTFRRNFTNNTGADLQRLRFRVVNLTTNPASGSAADLRVLTSSNTTASVSGGGTVNIAGTTLETPPTQNAGGGLNGTLAVPSVTIATPLAAGANVNLQFTTGVQVKGTYNFCLVPESLGPSAVLAPLCFSGNSENTPPTITPATLALNGGDSTNKTIATVSDNEDSAGSLTVTVISEPSGITVTGITNTSGTITAQVTLACSITTGAYNVVLQVVDSNGATTNGTLVINATATTTPAVPTITADTNGTGTTDQACPEQPLTLHANGATGATSYQWYSNNDLINGATSQTYQATGAATYYVTASNACGTSAQSAGYVVQNPTPHSAFITANGTMICSGGSVQLSSDSATGIQWYKDGLAIPGANQQQYVATAAGTYTAILDALGCHSQVSNSITLPASANPAPDATITAPATVLVNSSNNAASVPDAGAGATYSWSPFAGQITSGGGTRSVTFRFSSTGTHALSVTVTTADGCTTFGSVNVNVVNSMTATHFSVSAPATVTNGTPFSAVVTALDSTNSPVTNYAGTVHFTSSSAGTLPADYTFAGATDNGSKSFNVTLTTNGAQSLSVSDGTINGSANMTVVCPALSVTASNDGPGCTSVTITANTANAGVTFAWTGPNGFTSSQQSVSVTASGTYTVTLSYNGCTSSPSSTSVTILDPVPPTPTITATTNGTGTTDQACPEQPLTLTANGATGATSYQWYQDNAPINGATSQTYQAVAAGTYHVSASDSCGTSAVSAGYVVFNPTPHSAFITASGTMICSGGSVQLSSDSATGIQWYKDGVAIPGANQQQYVATAAGTYTAILDALGCHSQVSNSITLPASANAAPNATVTAPATVLVNSSNNAASVPDAGAGATYSWSAFAGQITSGAGTRNVTFRMNGTGTHPLSVTVTIPNGCTTFGSANVNVVNSMTATHFSVSAPATVTNGTPFSLTVTALDSTNSPVTNYSGTVHFTSSSAGSLPADYTFLGATDNGSKSFNATLTTNGAQSLSVSDGTINGSANVTVVCPALTVTASNNGPACGSVTINASTANSGITYAWTGPNGFTSSQQSVSVTTSGTYTVTISYNGCTSEPSSTSVTVNPIPSAAITAPASVVSGSTGNPASVANAGAGATYNWSITNGTITSGTGTNAITFTAGAAGTLTLQCTVTTSAGCSDTKSANVTVSVTVTSVAPNKGSQNGGIPVTINGAGFKSGATVTFGGAPATNVVVVNATKITAKTPAHAPGVVNVTVTNPDATTATLVNGYTYVGKQFDPNGDGVVDPSDIFYLVHYLFTNGPAPAGAAGIESGDANGDGVVDPSDIFYVINYLYMHGPAPLSTPGGGMATTSAARIEGSITLGEPVQRGGRWFVPVILSAAPGSDIPQALALRLRLATPADATVRRAGAGSAARPSFEITGRTDNTLSYIVSFDPRAALDLGVKRSAVVAEVELPGVEGMGVDGSLTMLANAAGTRKATVANGLLTISDTMHRTSPPPAEKSN